MFFKRFSCSAVMLLLPGLLFSMSAVVRIQGTEPVPADSLSVPADSLNSINGGRPILLESSVVSERAVRSSQNGDTLSFSAGVYSTVMGADAGALVAKMPGISVSDNGVEALGKDVRKIMVDGQEFFGDDVLTALKNIPADMIQQIEVINRMSDMAELTGVDDGNSYTAINVITKPDARNGSLTGRLYGGYGYPDRYTAGGNLSLLKDSHTASLIGMSNNISRFNFTSGDMPLGSAGADAASGDFKVKPLPGISGVHSVGANYGNDWFEGSYFFNMVDNENRSHTDRSTVLKDGKMQFTAYDKDYEASNITHRFDSRITFSPASGHSFIIRPYISFQDMSSGVDEIAGYIRAAADGERSFLKNMLNDNSSDRWYLKAGGSVAYRYRFPKRGRNIASSVSGYYVNDRRFEDIHQYTFNDQDVPVVPEHADRYSAQLKDNRTEQYAVAASLTYTEPLTQYSRMSVEYRFNLNAAGGDNRTRLWDKVLEDYREEPDRRQSALNSSSFMKNTANVRYSYGRKKLSVTATAGCQNTVFDGSAVLPYGYSSRKAFNDFTYSLTANLPLDKENTIRADARGRTSNPSVGMLQDVVNLNNMSNIKAGNPDIVPAFLHEAGFRYIHTDRQAGSTVSLSMNFTGSPNYFCDSLVIDTPDFVVSYDEETGQKVLLGEGNQYVKPVNMKGYWKLYGKLTYGFPFDLIRSNMNLNSAVSLTTLPGMINGDYVPVRRNWYSLGLRVDANISRNLDFMLSYTGRYAQNEYSGRYGKTVNNLFIQDARGSLKWISRMGLTLGTSVNYRQNLSTEKRFNDRIVLWDIHVGQRLFRDRRGEISLAVNDVFNMNVLSFAHSVSASGTSDTEHIGLGRYFSIQFVYHLRHYFRK